MRKFWIVFLLALTGCATSTVDFMNSYYDMEEVAGPIPESAPAGQSLVCFYGPKDFSRGAYIYEGGERVALALPGTCSCVPMQPGEHVLEGRLNESTVLPLDLAPGSMTYVRYSVVKVFPQGDTPVFEIMPEDSARSVIYSLQHIRMTDQCALPKSARTRSGHIEC